MIDTAFVVFLCFLSFVLGAMVGVLTERMEADRDDLS